MAQRLEAPLAQAFDAVGGEWRPVTEAFRASGAGQRLIDFIDGRVRGGATVYPADPLRALALTPLEAVRVVILGQDPYHGPGQAEGLAFSVPPGVKVPPSLRNIYQEMRCDPYDALPSHGCLVEWAQRGVLLLNTCLTVEQGQPGSHARKGWEVLTDALLAELAAHASPCVYMLWGAHAQAKSTLIEETAARHRRETLVLRSNHPSPLSARRPPAPFLGSGHFTQARDWLATRGHPGVF